ncbi:MAG: ribbon-helix-helix protein, CopG family [bacterium]|nr:ribbon-helix-helix protein, CopG family [bacterium]
MATKQKVEYTTTNVRLPKRDLRKLKKVAADRNVSLAVLLRQAISRYALSQPTERVSGADSLISFARRAPKTGVADMASRADEFLYGR